MAPFLFKYAVQPEFFCCSSSCWAADGALCPQALSPTKTWGCFKLHHLFTIITRLNEQFWQPRSSPRKCLQIKERFILKGFLKDSQMLLWNPELKNLLRSWCRNDFTFCSWVGGLFKWSFKDLQSLFQGCLSVTLYLIFSKASEWEKSRLNKVEAGTQKMWWCYSV